MGIKKNIRRNEIRYPPVKLVVVPSAEAALRSQYSGSNEETSIAP